MLHVGRDDLLAHRFASSPLWETMQSAFVLLQDGPHSLHHAAWIDFARAASTAVDLAALRAVMPRPGGYVPDFLTPPPAVGAPTLARELAELRATPLERVRIELARCRGEQRDPAARALLDELVGDPGAARERLAAALDGAWRAIVEPVWPRIAALIDADIRHRARSLAEHGLGRTIGELHPRVRWREGMVEIDSSTTEERDLAGAGLVLMPSAFIWPKVVAIIDEPWQPTLIYPARGIGDLWSAPPLAFGAAPALARLLGRTRGVLLDELAAPATTTALAARHGLRAGGVSAHLAALLGAGLVERERVGREVRYRRTRLGDAVVRGHVDEAG